MQIRCDATSEANVEQCSSCKRAGVNCSFSRVPMKRGPTKGLEAQYDRRIFQILIVGIFENLKIDLCHLNIQFKQNMLLDENILLLLLLAVIPSITVVERRRLGSSANHVFLKMNLSNLIRCLFPIPEVILIDSRLLRQFMLHLL